MGRAPLACTPCRPDCRYTTLPPPYSAHGRDARRSVNHRGDSSEHCWFTPYAHALTHAHPQAHTHTHPHCPPLPHHCRTHARTHTCHTRTHIRTCLLPLLPACRTLPAYAAPCHTPPHTTPTPFPMPHRTYRLLTASHRHYHLLLPLPPTAYPTLPPPAYTPPARCTRHRLWHFLHLPRVPCTACWTCGPHAHLRFTRHCWVEQDATTGLYVRLPAVYLLPRRRLPAAA